MFNYEKYNVTFFVLPSEKVRKIQKFTLTCPPFLWYVEKLESFFKINVFFWF